MATLLWAQCRQLSLPWLTQIMSLAALQASSRESSHASACHVRCSSACEEGLEVHFSVLRSFCVANCLVSDIPSAKMWLSETFTCVCMLFPLKSLRLSQIFPHICLRKKFPKNLYVWVSWCQCQGGLRKNFLVVCVGNELFLRIDQECICRRGDWRFYATIATVHYRLEQTFCEIVDKKIYCEMTPFPFNRCYLTKTYFFFLLW